ncbi:tetratricopeptide repeat protein [Methanosarcina horonobensis]|uniref:tetratricopeptide repeat protein n=1 Tax=Methanosarcina horonobensis TaxID=418008 RepID=UPI000A43967A|nr:tetratricopeptide repeat protein [Methanosarcina horonobensis]
MFGEEHPFIATALNNLAGLYQNKGEYEKAESLYNRALEIIRNSLGEEHPNVAITLNNLAGLYVSVGRFEEALLFFIIIL